MRCQGWKQNVAVYDSTAFPKMQANGKYAEMNSRYESVNVSGLHFIGTLGHACCQLLSMIGMIWHAPHNEKTETACQAKCQPDCGMTA